MTPSSPRCRRHTPPSGLRFWPRDDPRSDHLGRGPPHCGSNGGRRDVRSTSRRDGPRYVASQLFLDADVPFRRRADHHHRLLVFLHLRSIQPCCVRRLDFIGVVEHEMSEVLGRMPGSTSIQPSTCRTTCSAIPRPACEASPSTKLALTSRSTTGRHRSSTSTRSARMTPRTTPPQRRIPSTPSLRRAVVSDHLGRYHQHGRARLRPDTRQPDLDTELVDNGTGGRRRHRRQSGRLAPLPSGTSPSATTSPSLPTGPVLRRVQPARVRRVRRPPRRLQGDRFRRGCDGIDDLYRRRPPARSADGTRCHPRVGQAALSWTAPNQGASPITSYSVATTDTTTSTTLSPVVVSGTPATNVNLTSLTPATPTPSRSPRPTGTERRSLGATHRAAAGTVFPVAPARICDTRSNGTDPVSARPSRRRNARRAGGRRRGVPAGATALVANVTVTGARQPPS